MLLILLLTIVGIFALASGRIKITKNRVVQGSKARVLGVILLLGAASDVMFMFTHAGIPFGGVIALLIAIVWGLVKAEKPEPAA